MASEIVNAAHTDLNRHATMLGVIGTLGTADVKGSALTLPIGVNPDNGAMYVDVMDTTFNVGTLSVGTINKIGTVSSGSITLVNSAGSAISSEYHNGTETHLLVDSTDIGTTGTLGSLNATLEMPTHGMGACLVQTSGTWSGKILFEGAIDSTWNNLSMVQPLGGITRNGIQNDSQNGLYRVLILAGYSKVRTRMSSYTSGTATVQMNATDLVATNYSWQLNPENLNAQIQQIVTADDNNSSTANLAPNATYTGTITSTLGIAGIQVSLKTDQNCTVYIDQSPNTTPNWDITDEYKYYASIGNFGVTTQAINSYYRVRVTNTGAGTTTYFRLQTALCPIIEAVPRTLSDKGYLKVTSLGDEDGYGFESENTPIGEKRVVIPTRLVGASYDGTVVDPRFWGTAGANGGSITQANAQVTVTTGTAANGSATFYSIRRGRYVSASGMNYRAIVQQDAGSAGNKRRWGIAYGATMPTITDGAYFEQNGTTSNIVTLKGGTAGTVSTGSFNGNLGADYSYGTTVKTYEIYWTNSKVWFVIGDEVLHTFSGSATTWADSMSHYIFMDNVNSGGSAGAINSYCRVASIRRLGQLTTQPTSAFQAGVGTTICKYSPGNIHGMILSGMTNNSVVQLFDSVGTSTSVIWNSGALPTQAAPIEMDFHDIPFFTGLTLTVTAQNSNVMVAYE